MPMRRRAPALIALSALAALPLSAQPQVAHVHGVAHADVAIEGGRIEIVLRATAYDLVGFERTPADEAEKAKVQAARALLLDHARLWRFSVAARCVAQAPVLEVPAPEGMDHDHDHGHDHGHDHDHDHGGHVDWQARYRFDCATPAALRTIDAAVFDAVAGVQTLEVQLIDATGARALTLARGRARIELGAAP